MNQILLSRRAIFRWLVLSGVAAALLYLFRGEWMARSSSAPVRADGRGGLFTARQSARTVGAKYLDLRPDEADVSILAQALRLPDRDPAHAIATNRERLFAQHREDFRQGRMVQLNGWYLSVTELRLCALAHLSAQ